MIDFPSSPTLNQVVTGPDGISWKWDGARWVMIGPAGGGGTPGPGSITNAMLAPMPLRTVKGNSLNGTTNPQDLNMTTLRSMLANGSGGFNAPYTYLRGDGTWGLIAGTIITVESAAAVQHGQNDAGKFFQLTSPTGCQIFLTNNISTGIEFTYFADTEGVVSFVADTGVGAEIVSAGGLLTIAPRGVAKAIALGQGPARWVVTGDLQ